MFLVIRSFFHKKIQNQNHHGRDNAWNVEQYVHSVVGKMKMKISLHYIGTATCPTIKVRDPQSTLRVQEIRRNTTMAIPRK